jgi:hypothetical protein
MVSLSIVQLGNDIALGAVHHRKLTEHIRAKVSAQVDRWVAFNTSAEYLH